MPGTPDVQPGVSGYQVGNLPGYRKSEPASLSSARLVADEGYTGSNAAVLGLLTFPRPLIGD